MDVPRSQAEYLNHLAALERRLNTDEALRAAVGGEFIAMGRLEYQLLRSLGLKDGDFVVDVGCGSGRLASQLAAFPEIRYLGCDVVPRLVDYARELCGRPDWTFLVSDGKTIPGGDGAADWACFFSVFTHLAYEDTYRYLVEARRVLKPGGRVVLSFLDFGVPAHWSTFLASVEGTGNKHLDQYIAPETIKTWAAYAGFEVLALHAGHEHYIPLPEAIVHESGRQMVGAGTLGQSVAVLQKWKSARVDLTATNPMEPVKNAAVERGRAVQDSLGSQLKEEPTLRNISARATVLANAPLASGFVIGGNRSRRLLVRAIGPSLAQFGVSKPIARPKLEIWAEKRLCAGELMEWGGDAETAAIFAQTGAFALAPESKDAAAVLSLPPGSYSVLVKGATAADEGEALLELYFLD